MTDNRQNKGGENEDYDITQENISQVRAASQSTYYNEEDSSEAGEQTEKEKFYNDVNQQSERIQELVEQIEEFPNPNMRSLLAECMEAVLTLHGTGLERIFEIIEETDQATADVRKNLLGDNFIKGMLLIHGLHPDDLEARLHKALDKVKPYMDSHGGSVQVISLEDGVAKLKLEGSCDGCPSSASTLELGIKEAIEEECPDLMGLEVEGLADNPLANEIQKNNQKEGQGSNSKNGKSGYTAVEDLNQLADGQKQSVKVDGVPLVICNVDDNLYAYHNECHGCGMSFESGHIESGKLRCKLGHDFDVQKAGKCPDDPDIHLQPFPLIEENGKIKVAVG